MGLWTRKEVDTMKKLATMLFAAMMFLAIAAVPTTAQDKNWQIDVTPYLWMTGMDADVTVGNRTANVDVGFDDLIDYVQLGGGLIVNAALNNQWVFWFQGDYFSLEDDDLRLQVLDKLEVELMIIEAAFGYRFDNPLSQKGWIDALIGFRYTEFETTLTAVNGISEGKDNDYLDAMLVLRPAFPITEKLVFNPTLAVGAGDSDLIYELQPQLEYRFTDKLAGSIGYRRLYYDIKKDNQEFDGAFQGLIAGLNITF
jgi:hypothetical protein